MLDKYGEDRVLDTPLAEGIIIAAAIGSSMMGLRPVPEIQFTDFITPAMDQLVQQAAKIHYRSAGAYSCPITVRICCGGGVSGGLYHSQENAAWFVHEPGLKVVMPSTPYDAKGLLLAAIRDSSPVLFFEHKKLYRTIKGEVPEGDYTVPIGTAAVRREGKDLTIISYGFMVHVALEAAETMAKRGVEAEVIDLRTLSPIDKETILKSVRKTNKVLIVHEDKKTMGIGAEIAAIITEEAFDDLDGPVVRVTGAGHSGDSVLAAAREVLARESRRRSSRRSSGSRRIKKLEGFFQVSLRPLSWLKSPCSLLVPRFDTSLACVAPTGLS